MRAVIAARIDREDPLAGLEIVDRPEPEAPESWASVRVKAASFLIARLPSERLEEVLDAYLEGTTTTTWCAGWTAPSTHPSR